MRNLSLLGLLAVGLALNNVQAQKVVINELMYHPASENSFEEYLELYNADANVVDLTGWRLTSGVKFTFPAVGLAPGGYLVVAANTTTFSARHPAVTNVIGGWTGVMGNAGNTIQLENRSGIKVDSVSYASDGNWGLRREGEPFPGYATWWRGWQWVNTANGGGKSLELINPGLPGNNGQSWAPSGPDGGTPGAANSVLSAAVAPLIADVQHAPVIPHSTNAVTIISRIIPLDTNLFTVTLWHRIDGASAFSATPMFDDGGHGDGMVGDGVYGAVLAAQPDKTVVEFYIETRSASGLAHTWPGPTDAQGAQNANALYQVDDSVYEGRQPIYRLITTAADWNSWVNLMDNVSNGRFSDAQMNATFISVDGRGTEVRYLASVRNRGKGTRSARPHNLHVSFLQEHPWHGQTRLDLNTRTVHSQVAGNAMASAAGLPNAYGAPVQVRVNGKNLAHATPDGGTDSYQYGSYFAFEPYDGEWAARHMPADPNGNVYKGTWYFDWVRLNNNGATLNYLGDNPEAYRQAYSPTGPVSTSGAYSKQSNKALDDWSDLIELTKTLSQTPDSNYAQEVSRIVQIDEWLRYIAVNSLVGNMETTLGTGAGDDYSMYCGKVDRRFQLLIHDLDTTMGQGDAGADYARSIFKAADLPALSRFLKNSAIAPRYYEQLKTLANTTFTPERANPLLDQWLGDWVPASTIQNMKDFITLRRAAVLEQIPSALSVVSALPVLNGYPHATSNVISLTGNAEAVNTRAVRINGVAANWTAWRASWSATNMVLNPGLNHVLIQAFDAQGREIGQVATNIWYDNGMVANVSGTITTDTAWTASGGPYQVGANLTIGVGATLTIEPGAVVYLGSGVNLTVANGGRLLAEGTLAAPIHFTRAPGATTAWGGITINGGAGSPETRITYAHLEFNGDTAIHVSDGTVFLDHLTFGSTDHQYLSLDGSSFVVSHCHFPTPTAAFELAHGSRGIKSGGHGIFYRNYFGAPNGYNDVIDFTGNNRPNQPIVHFIDNVFTGASDDVLDLDGTDAWVEGNIFLHVHKNGSPDSSSAISGGDDGSNTSEITILGNIFYDCDQAAMAKQGNFFTLLNNTIVRQTHQGGLDTEGAVVCLADEGTTEGAGMYLEDNIMVDIEKLVRNQTAAIITFANNLMPLPWNGPGGGNTTNAPLLKYIPKLAETHFNTWAEAQIMRDWFSLLHNSPARGAGSGGSDKGGVIPLGALLGGTPQGTNNLTTATLVVGVNRKGGSIPAAGFPQGSGYVAYQWRLDEGAWSAETPIATPLNLTGLTSGPHYVEVIGKRDSGLYQNDPLFGEDAVVTRSPVWIVDANYVPAALPKVVFSEILAANSTIVTETGNTPDLVELHNQGIETVDLSGLGITHNATTNKFVFPPGTTLAGGAYLVLYADAATNLPGLHLGFTLPQEGDNLFLLDNPARGGGLLDAVAFGLQVKGLSIARMQDGQWVLSAPNLGGPNVPMALGNAGGLKINEWLADARAAASGPFIELFNPDVSPVSLGGLYLLNQPMPQSGYPPLADLSYIGAGGYAVFETDAQTNKGPAHLAFKLGPEPGALGLFGADFSLIDRIVYGVQNPDVAQGRSPNGGPEIRYLSVATPGTANPGSSLINTNITTETITLISMTNVWHYNQAGSLGTAWVTPSYNDSSWPTGAALLYVETSSLPAPKNTPLILGKDSYYFRTHFNVDTNLAGWQLSARAIIDDGAVFYLNGSEVLRLHITSGTVTYSTHASDHEATLEGPFDIPASKLVQGDNVLAVEVHQVNSSSSDIVMGMSLAASFSTTNVVTNTPVAVVRLSEIMANNTSLTNQEGAVTDWIELHNPSALSVNLSGMSITDDVGNARKWVFPTNAVIAPDGYFVLSCSGTFTNAPFNTGFALNAGGGGIYLFADDGTLLDSLTYGLQARNLSLGRIGATEAWRLTQPTPGAQNQAVVLGNSRNIKINEWMANPASGDDWFELYNPEPQPVDLSGLSLTDDLTQPAQYIIPALSFISAGPDGYQKMDADDNTAKGANHVNFKLAANGDFIMLFHTDETIIDQVAFGLQQTGISQGRLPDGSTNMVAFPGLATPGHANILSPVNLDTDGDLMPDEWELAHGLNPLDPTDATLDADGDGLINRDEYLAGTNPWDPASQLKITSIVVGHSITLTISVAADHKYEVLYVDHLAGVWTKLIDIPLQPIDGSVSVIDTNTIDRTRYYRVMVIP